VLVGLACLAMWEKRLPAQAPLVAPTTEVENALYVTRKICDLPDERIDESSGLGASRKYPGCLWTHNDSGDGSRLFLLSNEGKTLSEIKLVGADARDWEDMAVAGSDTNAWVYAGDIGDNAEVRPNIVIYRFREPEIDLKNPPASLEVACEKMLLTYPDAPHNAETLVAAPNGQLLIVTKSTEETLAFQTAQPFKNGATMEMEKLGQIEMPEGFRQSLTTAGDISPDGKKLIVTSYVQAHEWDLNGWKKDGAPQWSAIVQNKARVWKLPRSKQLEAVCFGLDNKTLYATSEQRPSPLFEFTPRP
jgi:hypothetical protein